MAHEISTREEQTMSEYTTPAQDAATIRETLKREHKWSSRQVSVRSESYSMGSSIAVIVRDPAIPLATVKAIAERAERIRYCEITHEILGGGNRFVSVKYSDEALVIIGRRYADAVQRAVDSIPPGSSSLAPVAGTDFLVGRNQQNDHFLTLWDQQSSGCLAPYLMSVDAVAQQIGVLTVAREAAAAEAK